MKKLEFVTRDGKRYSYQVDDTSITSNSPFFKVNREELEDEYVIIIEKRRNKNEKTRNRKRVN